MTVTMTAAAPAAGFADPVQQSQQAFRAMLDAMSRPGRMTTIDFDAGHPPGLAPALAAVLLTLCDLDTPVLLGPGFDSGPVQDWLRFHTGAPLTTAPQKAAVVLLMAERMPPLDSFAQGSDEAPEKGATLLVQVPRLDGAQAMEWRGPGIKTVAAMPLCGLPEPFWRQRLLLGSVFPRGIDIYLGHGRALVGLPRSTAISFPEA